MGTTHTRPGVLVVGYGTYTIIIMACFSSIEHYVCEVIALPTQTVMVKPRDLKIPSLTPCTSIRRHFRRSGISVSVDMTVISTLEEK